MTRAAKLGWTIMFFVVNAFATLVGYRWGVDVVSQEAEKCTDFYLEHGRETRWDKGQCIVRTDDGRWYKVKALEEYARAVEKEREQWKR